MTKIVGIGAGGHAKVIMDILDFMNEFELIGLVDSDKSLWGTEILGVPVLGGDSLLQDFLHEGIEYVFIGVGSTPKSELRVRLYKKSRSLGFRIVSAIHPSAIISKSAQIGLGPTVMAGAIINPAVVLGDNVIVNTGAIIEHDCTIGDHAHVATGAKLAGAVNVGTQVHIGAGAVIRENISIGDGAVVGAGAAVISDVPPGAMVGGVPARILTPRPGRTQSSGSSAKLTN